MSRYGPRPTPLKDRFWKYVDKSSEIIEPSVDEPCWIWIGTKDDKGYGRIGEGGHYGRMVLAHRLSYMIKYGEFDKVLYVCHRCDTPICVNPAHLFLGTQYDNMKDAKEKGRTASGERNGSKIHPERTPRGDAHYSRIHPEGKLEAEGRRCY